MDIIVYDFDKTIYDGDSTLDFYFYCLGKKPLILYCGFIQLLGVMLFYSKIIDKTRFKELFFYFLRNIDDCEKLVNSFWEIHSDKIKKWYTKRSHNDDVIISASPEFLLKPICLKLGIKILIASKVDLKTGGFDTPNCYGKEKVIRLKKELPNCNIKEFYSDSLSDLPLAQISEKSFIVNGNNINKWNL